MGPACAEIAGAGECLPPLPNALLGEDGRFLIAGAGFLSGV